MTFALPYRRRERMRVMRLGALALALLTARAVQAQTLEQIAFDEAVRRALASNPTIQQAAAGILRAEAILQQVAAGARPTIGATLNTTVIDPVPSFSGRNIIPRAQTQTNVELAVPLLTPVRWAQRAQAADQVLVSQQSAADVRREVAVATGQAYLAVIAGKRVLDLNVRSRDNAKAHYDFANQRYEGGIGSRLNALRAQQELSADEARVEEAQLAIRRAQEALGVLVGSPGPVDTAGEPTFETPAGAAGTAPPTGGGAAAADISLRSDIRLLAVRQAAAERVAADSWKDFLPSATAVFSPQVIAPSGLFANSRSWRASVLFSVPLLDSGFRRGQAAERQALVTSVRAERANAERQASSEVRTAREAVAATERALARTREAAAQANEVVRITDIAFREGATTNIELLDAQRQARDAETQAAITEDAVRRARLELLVATGRFPDEK